MTSRLVSDMCCFAIISVSDFVTAQQKKARGAYVVLEEEIAALHTPYLKAEVQQVPNQ